MPNILQRTLRAKRPEPAIDVPQKQSQVEMPPADELHRLIREAAYAKAEARQFAPGVELQDWLDAEKEVLMKFGAS
jgi:hypothetical protein